MMASCARRVARDTQVAERAARGFDAEDLLGQRALARAARPRERDEDAERDSDVDVTKVVRFGAADDEEVARLLGRAPRRARRRPRASGGDRPARLERRRRPVEDDRAPLLARAGAELDHAIRGAHDARVVLDHDDGISCGRQLAHHFAERRHVGGVEFYGRLVEHEHRSGQRRTQGRREPRRAGLLRRSACAPAD